MSNPTLSDDTILPQEAPLTRAKVALIILALAMGSFGIGTGEFVIMGLLPEVAREFGVSTPVAGHVISAYALGVVIGAPVLAVLGAKMSRRGLLLLLMGVFAIGNIVSAIAPTFGSFTLMRFLTGFPHGAYFGVASLVAASMAGPGKRTQAVGRVMLGLTLATLIGTPLATMFGQSIDWRIAFGIVGAIGILTVALIAAFLPKDPVRPGAGALRELGALKSKQVWLTLGIAATGFGGMFSVFTYIASTTTEVAGMSPALIPLVLALFGTGMVFGNIVGAWFADKTLLGTIGGLLVYNFFILAAFSLTAENGVLMSACVFLIGTSVAIAPALQIRLMDVAADAQTLAAALNHSAFNIANALGAWLGGLAIAGGYGFASTGWVGAILSIAGLIVFALSVGLERAERQAMPDAQQCGCAAE